MRGLLLSRTWSRAMLTPRAQKFPTFYYMYGWMDHFFLPSCHYHPVATRLERDALKMQTKISISVYQSGQKSQ